MASQASAVSPESAFRRRRAMWEAVSVRHSEWHSARDGRTQMVGLYRRFAIADCCDVYRAAYRRAVLAALLFGLSLLIILGACVVGLMMEGPVFVAVVLASVAALGFVVGYGLLNLRIGTRTSLVFIVSPAILIASISGVATPVQIPFTHLSLQLLMLTVAVSYIVVPATLVGVGIFIQSKPRLPRYSPGVAASGELVSVLCALSRENPLLYFQVRNDMMKALGRSADSVERDLPRAVRVPDAAGAAVFAQRCQSAARHLRNLRVWVALPKADTPPRLETELISVINALVRGTYDDLPEAEALVASRRGFVADTTLRVRGLVSGVLPLAAIIGARAAGLRLDGVIGDALIAFGVLWASVSLLMALDPRMTERLAAMREVVALLRLGEREHKRI